MFFCDFRYFLAEIEGLEQKSDLEVEEGLLMLLDSDLPTLKVDFLELQNSKWRTFNCVGKYTSRAFQKCIIVHTLAEFRRRKLALNASSTLQSGVKRQKHVTNQS